MTEKKEGSDTPGRLLDLLNGGAGCGPPERLLTCTMFFKWNPNQLRATDDGLAINRHPTSKPSNRHEREVEVSVSDDG